jgi:hypothetical protein
MGATGYLFTKVFLMEWYILSMQQKGAIDPVSPGWHFGVQFMMITSVPRLQPCLIIFRINALPSTFMGEESRILTPNQFF